MNSHGGPFGPGRQPPHVPIAGQHPAHPVSPPPYMGHAPGHPPHPVSPPPYMGQAPGYPAHPVSPPPYMGHAPGHPPYPVSPPPYMGSPTQGATPMMAAQRTVFGFPLEPGERVLYYRRIPSVGARVFYILFGIPMILVIGIGLFLIYLGITHRKQFPYAQVVTNRRLFVLDGRGQEMRGMRWESVVGLNKVSTSTGLVRQFGVRNDAGATCMLDEDLATVERFVTHLLRSPAERETWPEVAFDAQVN